ncbi:nucleotide exchange factor GrpE [Yimella sp. RIT 621]|uniref:nucleotide exchange factor GrpE n=1 Tax=unclassified Yimella TaxID=2649892 RepID=UPI001EFB269C|nr:nucleotide exchange factor GrpE [Yimella sp. RIT 621]MCG8654268.1 nucleotide exchange factor GrpE [Yimella sp. NH-Cas1]
MTDDQVGSSQEEPTGPVVRDKRRIDPETGELRGAHPADHEKEDAVSDDNSADKSAEKGSEKGSGNDEFDRIVEAEGGDSAFGGAVGDDLPNTEAINDDPQQTTGSSAGPSDDVHPDAALAAERLADLQRLQAEYVNYKRRVDRDREMAHSATLAGFVESLLPVLDEIHYARQHGDLEEGSPFAKIAAKLDAILGRYGLASFGEVGDAFDPMHHEALMHIEAEVPEGSEGTTVVQVMQPGYKVGERVVRPARVAVADPQ